MPDFPIPKKRKIHHDYLPIGLLKIGSYLRQAKGFSVELVFGNQQPKDGPDEIWITSLFTYWSEYVHASANHYRALYPKARIIVGGIYATLMPEHAKTATKASKIHLGVHKTAEKWARTHPLDYSLLGKEVDFQILHGMRGCFRRCKFCGTWRIEPREEFDSRLAKRIRSNHVVLYDNNFLRNPKIRQILKKLAAVKYDNRSVVFECQSGFDGRILSDEVALLLKKARFVNPRIAWDNSLEDEDKIRQQIGMLKKAGYPAKDIYTFILYNWEHDFRECETKRLKCWQLGVQISDCRFRPLDRLSDHYEPRRSQTSRDYFIHPSWTDAEVKLFRANVRKHNICIRHGFRFHSRALEHMKLPKRELVELNEMPKSVIKQVLPDAWFPEEYHGPDRRQLHIEKFETLANFADEEKLGTSLLDSVALDSHMVVGRVMAENILTTSRSFQGDPPRSQPQDPPVPTSNRE